MNFDDELIMSEWKENTIGQQIRLEIRLERSKGVYLTMTA